MKETSLMTLVKQPSVIERFKNAIGGGTATEKENRANTFLSSLVTVVNNNSAFNNVEPVSILSSALMSASLDLPINQNLGFAAIIPYGKQAQFQIMAKGFEQLAFRSGQIKALNAGVIYTDEFNGFDKIKGDLKPLNDHKETCQTVAGYFCFIALVNGFEKTEYWSLEKVQAHARKFSKSYNNGPWKTNFDAMAQKTVIKYTLSHYAPLSTQMQMQSAFSADQAIINTNKEGVFVYDYADNPLNSSNDSDVIDVEPKFTADEMAHRTEMLQALAKESITEKAIVESIKGANSIDDVLTSDIESIYSAEIGDGTK